jgi:hypothetical protein
MADQAGLSMTAIQAEQATLARQYATVRDADQVLIEALVSAHAATVDGLARLDGIAHEIERAVQNQAELGLDTAIGAREFQKFLIAKQREIIAVVTHAQEVAATKKAALEALPVNYAVGENAR